MTLRVGIVGFGKIARDRHVPALAAVPGVTLAAVADPRGGMEGVPGFGTLEALLRDGPAIDAVALCTPPVGRAALALAALQAGKHVLLEKPPGATLAEIGPAVALAEAKGLALFAAWHSRMAPGVEGARALLANSVQRVRIEWKEDVRHWHPGQDWVWAPGGMGVFDPGINALSILTRIMPRPLAVVRARLEVPAGQQTPIGAELLLRDGEGVEVEAVFDWRQEGEQRWEIVAETDAGPMRLGRGGALLEHAGAVLVDEAKAEYPALYRRFAVLAASGRCEVDLAPMVLVADAFMLASRREVAAFAW